MTTGTGQWERTWLRMLLEGILYVLVGGAIALIVMALFR